MKICHDPPSIWDLGESYRHALLNCMKYARLGKNEKIFCMKCVGLGKTAKYFCAKISGKAARVL